jgi:hypothetical protein
MQIVSEGWGWLSWRAGTGGRPGSGMKDLLNSSHSLASATPFSDIIGGRFHLVTATSDQSRLVEMSDEDHITWVDSVVELRSIMPGANLFGGRNN